VKRLLTSRATDWLAPVLWVTALSLSLALGGEGRGESQEDRVGWEYSPTVHRPLECQMVGEYAHPTWFGTRAQRDVPPLTLTLSPEYEGEGTGRGEAGESAGPRCAVPVGCEKPAPSSATTAPEKEKAPALPATRPDEATSSRQEINLLAMGDWGEGKPAQKSVADAMAKYVADRKTPFAALLSAGDNFYVPLSGVDDPVWQTLFEQMYDAKRLDFPFYAALGNHDYDQNKYLIELAYARLHPQSRWKLPARWYRVDLPAKEPLVTALMLDSDQPNLTAIEWALEKKFVAEELAKPRAPWTICVAHHPLFSNGAAADNGVLQKDWGAMFEKEHVDFYLCGHDHNLQHLEVKGWKESFVLAGGGGAHAHPLIRDNRGPFSRTVYGFVHFDVTPDLATVRYVGADGATLHEFTRTKAGEVKVTQTTPSDTAIDNPLEAIQGLYDKIHGAQTRPAPKPTTRPTVGASEER
jgi:tartrate-resistant acid phosphatase type 5